MKKLTVVLDEALYTATKVEAARRQMSVKELVADALEEWLEAREDRDLGPLMEEALAEYRTKGGVEARQFFDELDDGKQATS